MAVEQYSYGTTAEGREVTGFMLSNKNGMALRCINYGCRFTHLMVPDKEGKLADVVLGFDGIADYEADKSGQGAFIGRYANRISGGRFTLDGAEYQLTQNDGDNYLHGTFEHRVFEAEVIGENSLSFTYESPDGESGFPGEVWVAVTYTLNDENELLMDYRARTTADTHINLTNHSYFTLGGVGSGSVEDTLLWMGASRFLEARQDLCPTGRVLETAGGAFDFTTAKPIGQDIAKDDPQLKAGGGYDHCFILDKERPEGLALAAHAQHTASGRGLKIYTTQPAIQFYTANMLDMPNGKNGIPCGKHDGFCLETQHYPDSPNNPEFPSTLLPKGAKYHKVTLLKFEW